MFRFTRTLVLVGALVVASEATVLARDLCFDLPGIAGSLTFVVKGFAVPGRNKCKPISGFSQVEGWLLSGSVCRKADGTALRLAVAAHPLLVSGPNPFQVGCTIPFPAMAGGSCHGSISIASSTSDEVVAFASSTDAQFCTVDVP
jgi:hypothetical protein